MTKRHGSDDLALHRPEWRRGGAAVRFGKSAALREQLLREIKDLETLLERAKGGGGAIDFSQVQTYREMIHARKEFYRELDS